MKILIINVVFEKGSTGLITKILKNEYEKLGHNVHFICGRNYSANEKKVSKLTLNTESKIHHFISLFTGNLYGGMPLSTHKIINAIKKFNPDLIHIHCINGYFVNVYNLLSWIGKNKYRVILSMHADFMMTGGCGYANECTKYLTNRCKKCTCFREINGKLSLNTSNFNYKRMEKAISYFDKNKLNVTCVSSWLTDRYKQSPIYKSFNIQTVLNPNSISQNKTLNKYGNYFLYVTPDIYDPNKCGLLLLDLAKKCPNKRFIVISGKNNFEKIQVKNILFLTNLSREEIASLYSNAQATILLSKKETFSMVVSESLLCGTPLVGFQAGGPETIAISEYCTFLKHGDLNSLSKIINSFDKSKFNSQDIINKAKDKYDSTLIAKEYLKLIR